MPVAPFTVRDFDPARDLAWAEAILGRDFGGRLVARRGELVDVLALDGLVAERDGGRVGLLTWRRDGDACELAFLAATARREGIGSALVDALFARLPAATRVWLVTTAENRGAIRFYEAKGFRAVAVRPGAVDDARRTLKPTIPLADETGEPIRDEVDMETSAGAEPTRRRSPPEPGAPDPR